MNTNHSSVRSHAHVAGNSPVVPLYEGSARVWVAAPPSTVYGLVSDITRMGTYSPECYRCEWLDGATQPVVGAVFRGYNKWRGMSWSRRAEVIVADDGREFAFRTIPTLFLRDSTIWRYRFEAVNNGTQITESYALTYAGLFIRLLERYSGRPEEMPAAMQQTLERIKVAAEKEIAGGR